MNTWEQATPLGPGGATILASMAKVVILGAGPIAGELASTLTRAGVAAVILFDDDVPSMAAGKALDVQQACPIIGSDTAMSGGGRSADLLDVDVLVVADRGSDGREWSGETGLAQLARLLPRVRGTVAFAGASHAWLLERSVIELGRSRSAAIGSAPLALEAAVRAMAALEADCPVSDVHLTIAGRPPTEVAVLWDISQIAGEAATRRLDQGALRRIEARIPALWPPGPYALGSAASLAVRTILEGTDRTLTGFTLLDRRDTAVALPVRYKRGSPSSVASVTGSRTLAALGL